MDRFSLQKEFYHLVKSLPEEDIEELRQIVENFYIDKAIPMDDELITAEELEELFQEERHIAAGKGASHQEVMEKYGL